MEPYPVQRKATHTHTNDESMSMGTAICPHKLKVGPKSDTQVVCTVRTTPHTRTRSETQTDT
jgi:hypothetical protein